MSDGARILVTGGHGFVGRYVTRLLAGSGAEVVAPHRPGAGDRDGGLPAHQPEVDLRDPEGLAAAVEGVDLVVHLAALSGGIRFQEAEQVGVFYENLAMTRNVLGACLESGVRRAFLASSGVVYRDTDRELIPEEAPLVSPEEGLPSGYAWSKVTDEVVGGWLAEEGLLEVVVGRFTNVYGPGGPFRPPRSTVVHDLIRKAVEARAAGGEVEVWGDGSAVRSFMFVEDVARAVVRILEAGAPGQAYNVDTGEAVTIRKVAEAIRDLVDPSLELRFDPDKPTGVAWRVLDPSKLQALGFRHRVEFEEGLRRTLEAYRAEAEG